MMNKMKLMKMKKFNNMYNTTIKSSSLCLKRNMASKKDTEGTLSYEELKHRVEKGQIETVIVAFTDLIGRYMGKRYDAPYFVKSKDMKSNICDYLLTLNVDMAVNDGYKLSNWKKGYGDFTIVPDYSTCRQADWLDKTAIILCDIQNRDGGLLNEAPRSILRRQIERANKMGFGIKAASELEYYIYKNSYEQANLENYESMKAIGWDIEDYHILQGTREEVLNSKVRKHLRESGIVVESTKGEYGKGQHELNLKYNEVLKMADVHTVYKQCFKETADKLGMSVTFMAKPHADQSGSGCHIHINLENLNDGSNAFDGNLTEGKIKCSPIFRHFLAGLIKYTPESMTFIAPTINSYKRFQSSSWAPTRLAWCQDNRSAGFRIVGEGKTLRIENRIPGADCNPYLAFAACIAAGLEGIENKLEPPAPFEGNIYEAKEVSRFPLTLNEANKLFTNSEFCRKAFGSDVVDHYSTFFQHEVDLYNRNVTEWEFSRYFEQI